MRSSAKGNQVADQLLQNGFIELNDEVAQIYGEAMSQARQGGTFSDSTKEAYKASDFLQNTETGDFHVDNVLDIADRMD